MLGNWPDVGTCRPPGSESIRGQTELTIQFPMYVWANTYDSSGAVRVLRNGSLAGVRNKQYDSDCGTNDNMSRMVRPRGQRGWIYRKGAIYMLRWREEKLQPDGVLKIIQPSKSLGYFRTKSEARAAADLEMRKINTTLQNPESSMLLADFIEHHYFPHIEKRLRPSTIHGYMGLWDDYKRFWPALELREFRTLHGNQTLERIHEAKGVSKNTLKNVKSFMSAVFKHARRIGVLDSPNPMVDVSLPSAREGSDTYAYSLEEVTAMLLRLSLRSAAVVATAAFTGLRKGEIGALRWEHYRGNLLYVEKSKWRGHITDPKTKKSKSPVPVISALAKILHRWREVMGNPESGWMFGHGPLNMDNFDDRNIKPFTNNWHGWHAFRRGLSTTLHRLGVADKDIQQILRHEDIKVTQNSYIKTTTSDAVSAMRLLEDLVTLPEISDQANRQ
jgi:integrase